MTCPSPTPDASSNTDPVRVHDESTWHQLTVPVGTYLRRALLRHDLSPYTRRTQSLNCDGRGLCATCGVRLGENAPSPTHRHNRLTARYGYPRLSCQIAVDRPLTVSLRPNKRIWGARVLGAHEDADDSR